MMANFKSNHEWCCNYVCVSVLCLYDSANQAILFDFIILFVLFCIDLNVCGKSSFSIRKGLLIVTERLSMFVWDVGLFV